MIMGRYLEIIFCEFGGLQKRFSSPPRVFLQLSQNQEHGNCENCHANYMLNMFAKKNFDILDFGGRRNICCKIMILILIYALMYVQFFFSSC